MKYRFILGCVGVLTLLSVLTSAKPAPVVFCGTVKNDLYRLLKKERFKIHHYGSPLAAISGANTGSAVFMVAEHYPEKTTEISPELLGLAKKKHLKLYIEYSASFPGLDISQAPLSTRLERGVITSAVFGEELPPMSILGINDCHILKVNASDPLIVLAKVAGLDRAEYGIDDVETYPLLFENENMLIAMSKLSNFATGRYGPGDAWKQVWTYILSWMTGNYEFRFKHWPSYVYPMYTRNEPLPEKARAYSVEKGVEWFNKGRFFIHPSWKEMWLKYQGNGSAPFGPPVPHDFPNGDGTLGLLEGHASNIYFDGTQQYRYWIRADVQGEAAYALAAAGDFLEKKKYYGKATNLLDFIFHNSNLRSDTRSDQNSPSFGLIGWSVTHPGVFYGDDNARTILGILGASAYMKSDKWDKEVVEAIMANFRTTGKQGFRGSRLEEKGIHQFGWEHFWERDITNPAPHFESWIWACYLWLYDKTAYEPLLTKTKNAIRMTMEAYPDQWLWTNGIQQERARMILPLAWLVQIEDTEEHRGWLDQVVTKLLENQVACGAIREELGSGKGKYGRTESNKAYGLHEAPLIFENGDPIADMLYTSNFAFFSLNEAAHATGSKEYKKAVDKLSEFLVRAQVQVKSNEYRDLDGAWFRAFEYDRWEYWASNADVGWGAWGTLTGWTQSWIVATQVLTLQNQSFWELTRKSTVNNHMAGTVDVMFKDRKQK
jgi:hypothetical protein